MLTIRLEWLTLEGGGLLFTWRDQKVPFHPRGIGTCMPNQTNESDTLGVSKLATTTESRGGGGRSYQTCVYYAYVWGGGGLYLF